MCDTYLSYHFKPSLRADVSYFLPPAEKGSLRADVSYFLPPAEKGRLRNGVALGKDSVGTSASPEKRILLEESIDRFSNDLSSLVTSTPVKAIRNTSVRKIQIPPLSPVRPPTMERSEGNDSGTENKTVLS